MDYLSLVLLCWFPPPLSLFSVLFTLSKCIKALYWQDMPFLLRVPQLDDRQDGYPNFNRNYVSWCKLNLIFGNLVTWRLKRWWQFKGEKKKKKKRTKSSVRQYLICLLWHSFISGLVSPFNGKSTFVALKSGIV